MADEMSLSITYSVTRDSVTVRGGTGGSITPDVSASARSSGVASIGTSEETISKGEVGTIGFVYLRNLDSTNYVEFAGTTTDYVLKLKAGEAAFMRWNKTNVLARANTAACNVEYQIFSD